MIWLWLAPSRVDLTHWSERRLGFFISKNDLFPTIEFFTILGSAKSCSDLDWALVTFWGVPVQCCGSVRCCRCVCCRSQSRLRILRYDNITRTSTNSRPKYANQDETNWEIRSISVPPTSPPIPLSFHAVLATAIPAVRATPYHSSMPKVWKSYYSSYQYRSRQIEFQNQKMGLKWWGNFGWGALRAWNSTGAEPAAVIFCQL
jgi:hypothetical protein